MKLVLPTNDLLEARDYRTFLSIIYNTNKKISSQFSYAYIAKQCHISSKGFIKDVIDGKKKLSLESTHKFITGLNFPTNWGKYFLYLVITEEKFAFSGKVEIHKELARLRSKLSGRQDTTVRDTGAKLFETARWPLVYAALGTRERGATLEEVISRTRMGTKDVGQILSRLITENLVVKRNRRFYPLTDTAFFEDLKESGFFKDFYIQAVSNLLENARKNFKSDNSLFYTLALSVDPERMPNFRRELADLLDKYTVEIEAPEGARIATLTCGFHLV